MKYAYFDEDGIGAELEEYCEDNNIYCYEEDFTNGYIDDSLAAVKYEFEGTPQQIKALKNQIDVLIDDLWS